MVLVATNDGCNETNQMVNTVAYVEALGATLQPARNLLFTCSHSHTPTNKIGQSQNLFAVLHAKTCLKVA